MIDGRKTAQSARTASAGLPPRTAGTVFKDKFFLGRFRLI